MSEQNNSEMIFHIQRVYIKDISFETPNLPQVFQLEWQPEMKLDVEVSSSKIDEDLYEVVLRTTVVTTVANETAFLCEVQQAGLFAVSGLDETQLAHCLGAYCPNILFPYARETISNLVTRGTFPQLNLAPVNFEALFMSQLQQQVEQRQSVGNLPQT